MAGKVLQFPREGPRRPVTWWRRLVHWLSHPRARWGEPEPRTESMVRRHRGTGQRTARGAKG
jgi:hypothetical protein